MYANSQRVLQNEKAGFKTFVWQTVGDNRVRSAHQELDGKVFTWEEGANGSFPSQAIACRCSAEVNEDEVNESVKGVDDEYGFDKNDEIDIDYSQISYEKVNRIEKNVITMNFNSTCNNEMKSLINNLNPFTTIKVISTNRSAGSFVNASKVIIFKDVRYIRDFPNIIPHEVTHSIDYMLGNVYESDDFIFQTISSGELKELHVKQQYQTY